MTLKELIDKSTFISKQVTACDNIPVYINNTSGTIAGIQLSQDNNGKHYVNIDTLKRYYATGIKTTNLKSKL